jgi:FkbM family methyltransferase
MDIPRILSFLPLSLRRHTTVKCLLGAFPNSQNQWIEFNGEGRAYVNLGDPEMRNVFLKKSFEPDFFRIVYPILAEGGVFFDCGANFGLCTFGLLPHMERDRLSCHLFEANPNLIPFLKKSKTLFPSDSITIVEGCLSERSGDSRFQICSEFTGRSRVNPDGEAMIKNVVLDDYLEQNKIAKISFLKMDIEGWELKALSGLSRALKRNAIEVIYFEIASDVLGAYGLRAADVTDFLVKHGFCLFLCRESDTQSDAPTRNRFAKKQLNNLRLVKYTSRTEPFRTDLLAIHQSQIVGEYAVTD